MTNDDVTKPCSLFMKELDFHKRLDKDKQKKKKKYSGLNIDDIVNEHKSPVEITIRVSL